MGAESNRRFHLVGVCSDRHLEEATTGQKRRITRELKLIESVESHRCLTRVTELDSILQICLCAVYVFADASRPCSTSHHVIEEHSVQGREWARG
jgi:hypothetical protein